MRTRNDLRPAQVDSINLIKEKQRLGLVIKMGGGKTAVALTAISDLLADYAVTRVLVVAPKLVIETAWPTEKDEWQHLQDLSVVKAFGTPKQRARAVESHGDVVLISVDNIKWLVDEYGKTFPFDMIVIDESTKFKSHSSQRFKAIKKVLQFTSHIVLLTGTPIPNGYMDIWAQMYMIDYGKLLGKNITNFRQRFFQTGGFKGYDYTLIEGKDKVIQELIADKMIAIQAPLGLSEPLYVNVKLQLPQGLKAKYEEIRKTSVIELNGQEDLPVESKSALYNKLIQFSSGFIYDEDHVAHHIHSLKLDMLHELIDNNPGENFFISYLYQADKEKILKSFPGAQLITDPGVVEKWNAGKVRVLLAHPASAAHGLNLQYGGSVTIWYGVTYDLELYQQLNARLNRPGQKDAVRIYHIVAEDTLDMTILEALSTKGITQDLLVKRLETELKLN